MDGTMWSAVKDNVEAGPADGFSRAVDVWINKPHVLNRRLCGTCHLHKQSLTTSYSLDDCVSHLEANAVKFADKDSLQASVAACIKDEGDSEEKGPCNDDLNLQDLEIIVRDLHPKQLDKFMTQREIILRADSRCVIFIPLLQVDQSCTATELSTDLCYRLDYSEHDQSISLSVKDSSRTVSGAKSTTLEWLCDQFVTRIAHWSLQENLNTCVTSLRLVPVDKYNQKYHEMKTSYGPRLVRDWKASTDPQKFVYEDIAIAAYLLTLWEVEREEYGLGSKQSFIDLGCGNGLLVHLLALEGHPGMGIDLRKRNTWDMFGPETTLKELPICPSDANLFPEYDWLIGNHSDELTPWIPVIAARSSEKCRYFVLPCCAHDFDAKFSEKRQGISQYRGYLDYIQYVGQVCGFKVEEDTLRIPSTKRVCFIGKTRTYQAAEKKSVNDKITDLITRRCKRSNKRKHSDSTSDINRLSNKHKGCADGSCSQDLESGSRPDGQEKACSLDDVNVTQEHIEGKQQWATDFQARTTEVQRNCLKVAKIVTEQIVTKVFSCILDAEDTKQMELPDGRTWNAGGSIALSAVAAMFNGPTLQQLKSEHGGLQTLLRNNYHVFRVQGGKVHLRDMGAQDEQHWDRKKKQKGKKKSGLSSFYKTRLCYLHAHHPDGCPKLAADCRFAHGQAELRTNKPTGHAEQISLVSGQSNFEQSALDARQEGEQNALLPGLVN